MRNRSFGDEAEACRKQAAQFAGRPEAQFLLRIAHSFEELEIASIVRSEINSSRYPPGGQVEPGGEGLVGQ
jgi:hypothetical protein